MPQATTKIKPSSIKQYALTLGSPQAPWKYGVISYVNQARLPAGAVVQAVNCMQTQDGVWSNRWGSQNYGVALTGPITGAGEFVIYNADNTTTQSYWVIDNGVFKYAKDGGAWTTPVTAVTFNTSVWTTGLQYNTKLLFCNGKDRFCYFDLFSLSMVTFTPLSAPSAPTPTLANLTSGNNTIYYQVTAVSLVGETAGSSVTSVSVNIDRANWYDPGSSTVASTSPNVALAWPTVPGAVGYNIYASDNVSGVAYYLDSVVQPAGGTVNFTDYGNNNLNDFQQVPASDTTSAPKFSNIAVSSNRLWATGDPVNPQRVYYAATTPQYAEAFNPFVGGGWFDIQPGTNQRPRVVHQFRDGKGDPLTTILMAEPSGYGSTWHCSIGTDTIGNSVITVPTLMQSLGTFGSLSPLGVVETNQNVYFHSGVGGFFSTGSVPTLFNVLATQEVSIMVRPDIQNLNLAALPLICGIEFQRKLFWSVPYNSTTNNRIMVYDLEKNNWNPYAFDFGVKFFFRYTDNSGGLHLLAVPNTGTQLLEISSAFTTDNGAAINCNLQTGLIHVDPSHTEWAHITYDIFEFDNPTGSMGMIFSGTPRTTALEQLVDENKSYGSSLSPSGFSSFQFSAAQFSNQPSIGITGNNASNAISVKHRQFVNKLINNWEMSLITSGQFTLNTFTVQGQFVPVPPPSGWVQ